MYLPIERANLIVVIVPAWLDSLLLLRLLALPLPKDLIGIAQRLDVSCPFSGSLTVVQLRMSH